MESHENESDHGSDGDDMFEDLIESEDGGDYHSATPHSTDLLDSVDSSSSGSKSLSLGVNEFVNVDLHLSAMTTDYEDDAEATLSQGGASNIRGSCAELEAKIGAMLEEDCDPATGMGEVLACELMAADDVKPDATTETLAIVSDQLGDAGMSTEDAGPGTGTEGDGEDTALDSFNTHDIPQCQDETDYLDCQNQGIEAPEAIPDEFTIDNSNAFVDESKVEDKFLPEPTPNQSPPVTPTIEEGGTDVLTSVTSEEEAGGESQQPGIDEDKRCMPSALCNSPTPSRFEAGYSMATVFPVVYESDTGNNIPAELNTGSVVTGSQQMTHSVSAVVTPGTSSNASKRIETRRLALVQQQLEATKRELHGAKKSFGLQLSLLESDKKTLGARNARLQSQLSSATADLQRVSSELARLRTENELFAAKLPQLQAELQQETARVDESRSQSLQAQLSVGQLKARAQVIQKRNEALEATNANLFAKLRDTKQELRRKADMVEQQAGKIAQLESNGRDEATRLHKEMTAWKQRLSIVSHRAQQELSKAASEWKLASEKQAHEARRVADKGAKKRRELEASVLRLEDAVEQHKREGYALEERVASAKKETMAMKAVLKKAVQTEAALRSDIAALRSRRRDAETDERVVKERISRPVQGRRLDALEARRAASLCRSDRDQDEALVATPPICDAATMTLESPEACARCPQLAQELRNARQELTRVRSMHAQELRAQAQAMEALLKANQVQSA